MGIFNLFKEKKVNPDDIDYIAIAEDFEKKGDYHSAINEYEKLIAVIYKDKPESRYRHIYKKIILCYIKLGEFDKVLELWPSQFEPIYYSAKEMYDLVKVLEQAQRNDLVMKAYDLAGNKLIGNKIEFLIKNKKIPEANQLLNEALANISETSPALEGLWLTKAKVCMSLMKWEEANRYLSKLIDKNPKNLEARKLKEFCVKQARM